MPKVSVIVPNYNHSRFLVKRLESILNQTYQDFEVIILDDCSPDHSREIISSYASHPRVKQIVYNSINSGSTFFQWNKGVEFATGDLIWIAESDDTAEPELLENLIKPFEEHKNLVLSYCQSKRMNDNDDITGSWLDWTASLDKNQIFRGDFLLNGCEYIKNYLIVKNTIPNASAVLFKKEIYQKVGGATPELRTTGDWEVWLKILTLGDVFYTALSLNNFRYHNNSVIAKFSTESKITDGRNQILAMYNSYSIFLKQYNVDELKVASEAQKNIHLKKQVMYKIRKHIFEGLGNDIGMALTGNWLNNFFYLTKISLQVFYFSSFKLLLDKLQRK